QPRIVLDADGIDGHARIAIKDDTMRSRILLTVNRGTGTPTFMMWDRNAKAGLYCDVSREPSVVFFDRHNKDKLRMRLVAGTPSIELNDDAGKVALNFDGGPPGLRLFDAKGNVLWQAPR
ncbi:MAG: hypothetical protein ACYS0K_22670, partial [Planctomycetota bacterium]